MHRAVRRGRTGDPVEPLVIRSLTRDYRVFGVDAALLPVLGFIEATPDTDGVPLPAVAIRIEPAGSFYRMTLPDGAVLEADGRQLLERLHRLLMTGLADEIPEGVLLHAACLVSGPSRLVIVGDKGTGKTTLAVRLFAAGFEFEGDEHVAIRPDDVTARPRRLRIKQSSLRLLPDLGDLIADVPSISDWDGNRIYSVDPRLWNRPWQIDAGAATHFVFIEPNHGGRSVLTPLPFNRAFDALVANAIFFGESRLGIAVRLRRHLLSARSWRLSLGDHPNAIAHLQRLASA